MLTNNKFAFALFIFLIIQHSHASAQTVQYNIHIQALRVSNDDGLYRADITPSELNLWLDYANSVYNAAGIKFLFDSNSPDFLDLRSSLINSIDSDEVSYNWDAQKSALDNEVAKYPGKLTVFFIYGDSSSGPRHSGFSWLHYNFVVMPGFNEAVKCEHQNISMLAHELGHYFGLLHTFEQTFTSKDSLLKKISQYGIEYMDGDALSSTPLDPALYKDKERPMECYDLSGINDTVSLDGNIYRVPRNNLMSYYDSPEKILTNEQIAIILNTLHEHPFKKNLVSY